MKPPDKSDAGSDTGSDFDTDIDHLAGLMPVSDEALIRAALEAAAFVADLQEAACAEWSIKGHSAPVAVEQLSEVASAIRALATDDATIAAIMERAKG